MKAPSQLDPGVLKSLNRRLLTTQYLSRKASGPRAVVKVAEACCGINSQDFLESFSSFWARVDGFRDSDLTSELKPKGGLVRTWTVRFTMHTIPARDYWVHLLGGPCFQRFLPYFDRAAKHRGIPEQEWRIRHLYEPLLDRIKGRTITSNEIKQFMIDSLNQRGLKGEMKLQRGWQSKATHGPAWSGFNEMAFLGLLVNVGREGSESVWMGSADYLPTRQRPDPEECLVELIRKYIEHYDPVTRKDIVYWSYLTVGQVNRALEAMKKDLRKETISGQEYLSIDGESSEKLDPPGVIILPEFDSLMMGHRDKSRIFPPASQKKIFLTLGRISRTILLDGFVAATWKRKKERSGILVDVSPLRRLAAREKGSIEEEFVKYADYRKTQISVQFK